MSYCANCGKELPEGSSFCPNCGEKVAPVLLGQLPEGIRDEDFIAFIGKNAERYLPKFRKFNIGGVENFTPTWHWPAFFIGFWWLLYRKLYLWALIAFIVDISFIFSRFFIFPPFTSFVAMIIWGVAGNYIYYRHAKKQIIGLRSMHPSEDITKTLSQIGGVNRWVWIIAVIFIVTIFIFPLLAYLLYSYNQHIHSHR